MSDNDKNLIPPMTADELRDYTPLTVRDDLNVMLNYLLRAPRGLPTIYEGQQHPPHVQAALRLQKWIGGGE